MSCCRAAHSGPLVQLLKGVQLPGPVVNQQYTVILLDVANMGGITDVVADFAWQHHCKQRRVSVRSHRHLMSVCAFVEHGVRSRYESNFNRLAVKLERRMLWREVYLNSSKNAADMSIAAFVGLAWRSTSIRSCVLVSDDLKLSYALQRLYPPEFLQRVSNDLEGITGVVDTLAAPF